MKSLPHVNASSLSPPLSHQLNLTNDIRDINCSLCYWLKSERISDTRTRGVTCLLKACLVRLLQHGKSWLKEVRSQNKSAHRIIVGYVGAPHMSIVLSNLPVPVKLQRIFLLSLCEGSLKRSWFYHFANGRSVT